MGFLFLAVVIAASTIALAIALGNWFPRTTAYLLGPCLFLFAAGCLILGRRAIFGSQYDVAIPGNFAPIIFGIPLAFLAIVGVVLVVTGLARIQRADEAGEGRSRFARDTTDFSRYRPREGAAWLTPRKWFVVVAVVELLIVLALIAYYR